MVLRGESYIQTAPHHRPTLVRAEHIRQSLRPNEQTEVTYTHTHSPDFDRTCRMTKMRPERLQDMEHSGG